MVASAEGHDRVRLTELSIPDCFLIESPVRGDDRGLFREWYRRAEVAATGVEFEIQQANFAMSKRDVVRGLHYTLAPEGQAKLVTCVHGRFDDVIVDIRVGSPTFGRVEVVSLAADEDRSVLVPAGAAHGYCVTSELGAISYLLSSPYNAAMEREIYPFDPTLGVPWSLSGEATLSEKDAAAPTFEQRREAGELTVFAPPRP